jgi:hypothetical protein
MTCNQIVQPDLRRGFAIFTSRPLSLITALILAIVLCIISFLLLTFPVIAGYYYAVRHSKREEYFIDLNNIFRTAFFIFTGIKRFFIQSYILGIIGILLAIILLVIPLLPLQVAGEQGKFLSIVLQILWLPAFFLYGGVVLYDYPHLISTNNAIGSLRYALSEGKASFFKTLFVGFLILFPIPGVIFHLLMGLTYPFLVAWAVSVTDNNNEFPLKIRAKKEVTLKKCFFTFARWQ